MSMDTKFQYFSPEVWGGIECTINRVNHKFFDQLQLAGHYTRDNDIELIAALGIKALRYPVLWELHQPEKDMVINWTWIEKQLNTIRSHNITPIAGLVHHGSGPIFTNLMQENFVTGLAHYAGAIAKKFPWIEYYTPVNEPLTTARFSGLYGFWYPHHADDRSFVKMLMNQMSGIVLAMQSIRRINPAAKLVQTEDLGKTYCNTPLLQYQADFENERRWLTFDLLCGKVNAQHYMWDYLIWNGATEERLNFFIENPCVPDIAGFNYYITSERFLDNELQKYPAHLHGSNWWENYVDTEAIRVKHNKPCGLRLLLNEAWERFKLPVAITEVHLHCTRDEQLRWLIEIYETCCELIKEGLDIKAVTAWSLFGAYGWNKLLTDPGSGYEPGAFDLRSPEPRPTHMARLIKSLASQSDCHHPVLQEKGWWHREDRFLYNDPERSIHNLKRKNSSPLLIIGKRGTLGKAFARISEQRSIDYRLLSRDEFDLCKPETIEKAINYYKPWAIINAAGFVRVDDAETEAEKCFSDNTWGPQGIAIACKRHGIKLVTFSSDLVFDGQKKQPYVESDVTNPLNIYGKSKAQKEKLVLQADPSALVIRTSAFFSPWDEHNFVHHVINTISCENYFTCVNDITISPTYVPDLVNASLDLLIDDEKNIWHLANQGEITWSDLAYEVAGRAGFNQNLIIPEQSGLMNWPATRPYYSVLKSERGVLLPTLENALARYFYEKKCAPVPETI